MGQEPHIVAGVDIYKTKSEGKQEKTVDIRKGKEEVIKLQIQKL